MSEREVREAIRHQGWCTCTTMYIKECSCGLDKLLSEPPDVVVLLRKMVKLEEIYENIVASSKKASYDYEEAVGNAFDSGTLQVTKSIVRTIEKTVRLTDDGWEWVEPEDIWYSTDSDDLAELPVEDGE